MLDPKPGWFLSKVLVTFLTVQLEKGAATEARTSPIYIQLLRKRAQKTRLDTPSNMGQVLCWLRSLVGY